VTVKAVSDWLHDPYSFWVVAFRHLLDRTEGMDRYIWWVGPALAEGKPRVKCLCQISRWKPRTKVRQWKTWQLLGTQARNQELGREAK